MWGNLVLTMVVGTLGGILFHKLKMPAGMLVGTIFAVAVLSVSTPYAVMPTSAKLVAQIITGAFIGTTISKEDILHLPRIFKPYLVVMGSFFILNCISGLLIYYISPMDLLTSLLCAMPSGVSDTPLIALDMGADAAQVALMQVVRMIFGLGGLPALIVLVDRLAERREGQNENAACEYPPDSPVISVQTPQKHSAYALPATLAASAVGGLFGKYLGIPAGTLAFAMLVTIVFKLLYTEAYMPRWCRKTAQVLSGCCIGTQITLSDILELRYMLLPAVILVVGYIINCVLTGHLMHRLFGISRREGMLCVSPAGATEMALISADLGVCSADLIVLQICRLIGVMAVFPQMFPFVISLLGG